MNSASSYSCHWEQGSRPVEALHDELANGVVQVWCASLAQNQTRQDTLMELLNEEERDRANRFHLQPDRDRFVAARGQLRELLSQYLSMHPRDLQFVYGETGKPSLSQQSSSEQLCFNLSYSEDLVLYALSRKQNLGVDIERIHPMDQMDDIVYRFFSDGERQEFAKLATSEKQNGFYACWTRKEAFVKALGEGLSVSLDSFDVSVDPNKPAELRSVSAETTSAKEWSLTDLHPADGFAAALVVQGELPELSCLRY